MILSTHALVGAAIGKNVSDPWLIILISLVVHFLLDGLRHGEYFDSRTATIKNTWWKVTLDLLFGLGVIAFYIIYNLNGLGIFSIFNILLGAFFSMLPDLSTVLYWKFHGHILTRIKKFHEIAHRYGRFPQFSSERAWTLRNAVNDILISAIAVLLLFFF